MITGGRVSSLSKFRLRDVLGGVRSCCCQGLLGLVGKLRILVVVLDCWNWMGADWW